jgi:hypothetical protein
MDFSLFSKNNTGVNQVIQKDADTAKYEEIAMKLCGKRRTLEKDLTKNDLNPALREEYALELMRLKESLTVFGISEIDYQAYLAKIDTLGEEPTLQGSLF